MARTVELELDGPIARVSLNRPKKRNALDQAMWEALPALFAAAASDARVRVMVLGSTTAGMFCAGADIAEFAASASDPEWQGRNRAAIRAAQVALAGAPMPTIAVVDGDCIGGGCGLALACDMRIASSRARFGITPAKLGLVYPLHDTRLLVDLVGPGQAKRMLFTGEMLSAREAFEIGLIEKLSTVDDLAGAVDALAGTIAANSPFSTAGVKATVRRILAGTPDDDEESVRLFDAAFAGADFTEGVAAFQARRTPRFVDR